MQLLSPNVLILMVSLWFTQPKSSKFIRKYKPQQNADLKNVNYRAEFLFLFYCFLFQFQLPVTFKVLTWPGSHGSEMPALPGRKKPAESNCNTRR
jgi:hypothetical protein